MHRLSFDNLMLYGIPFDFNLQSVCYCCPGADPRGEIWPCPPSIFAMDFGPSNEEKTFSLIFSNLCYNAVKKLVSEIRKRRQLCPFDH